MTDSSREGYVAEIRGLIGSRPLLLPSVTMLVERDGRVLYGRHRDSGQWVPPGGSVEPGETPVEAGVREAKEETGLVVRPTRLVGVFGGPEFRTHYPNGDVVDYVCIVFAAEVVGGELAETTSELSQLAFLTGSEVDELDCPDWLSTVRASDLGYQPLDPVGDP